MEKPAKGWHPDPTVPNRWNYWDGKRWNGVRETRESGTAIGHFRMYRWQKHWYGSIVRNPAVFYPLAWLNCSVPGIKGRLNRLMNPPQARRP
jgi:hypothetical protein